MSHAAVQVDAASSDDEEVAVPTDAAAADPNAIALKWEDDDDDSPVGRRQRPMEKKTKKERSREVRKGRWMRREGGRRQAACERCFGACGLKAVSTRPDSSRTQQQSQSPDA